MRGIRFACFAGMLIISVALQTTLPLIGHAQDSTAIYSQLGKGSSALQFQINSNFTLKSFSGTLISFQKTLSQRNAIRWGLSLDGAYQKDHNDTVSTQKRGNFNITIGMNYLWYAHLQHRIRFYYGFGPRLRFGYQNDWHYTGDGQLTVKTATTDKGIGIEGVAGVEWFVNEHISLIAEYLSLVEAGHKFNVWRSRSGEDNSSARTGTTTYSVTLKAEPVRFGVSIYF